MKDPVLNNGTSNMAATTTATSSEVILNNQLNQLNQFNHFGSEDDPFAEYMWMENEEEFDRQVEEELLEEEFLERCFQEMLEEEELEWFIPSRDLPPHMVSQLQEQLGLLVLDADADVATKSSLNPNAKEFTPGIQKHVM